MPRPLQLNPDRLFPAEPATRAIARALYARRQGPADRQPARPYRSRLVRDRRALDRRDRAAARARPLSLPDALQPGRAARARWACRAAAGPSSADPREAWRLFAAHYHLFRGTPVAALARPCLRRGVRPRRRARGGNRRPLFRPHRARRWRRRPSAPAPCSTGSASSCWRPPRARTRISSTTPRSALRAGPAGWSPPTGPTR